MLKCLQEKQNSDWSWCKLSDDLAETNFDYIIENIDLPWDWGSLSSCIKLDIISKYPDLPWDWNEISINIGRKFFYKEECHINFIITYSNKLNFLNLTRFYRNSHVIENIDLPWDFNFLL